MRSQEQPPPPLAPDLEFVNQGGGIGGDPQGAGFYGFAERLCHKPAIVRSHFENPSRCSSCEDLSKYIRANVCMLTWSQKCPSSFIFRNKSVILPSKPDELSRRAGSLKFSPEGAGLISHRPSGDLADRGSAHSPGNVCPPSCQLRTQNSLAAPARCSSVRPRPTWIPGAHIWFGAQVDQTCSGKEPGIRTSGFFLFFQAAPGFHKSSHGSKDSRGSQSVTSSPRRTRAA